MGTKLRIKIGDSWHEVEVLDLDADPIEVIVDGEPVQVAFPTSGTEVKASAPALPAPASRSTSPSTSGATSGAPAESAPTQAATPPAAGPVKVFSSPMPGVIVSVAVKQGDQVVPGDEVCVLEAMKMQQTLRAEWAGMVREVHVETGQQMQGGDPIVTLE
jgi:biotin carboxyl carrier protein